MARAPKIDDRESLERWQKGRSREDSIVIAQRSALRLFPLFAGRMGQDWAREGDLTALPVFRALLTSGVARKYPTTLVIFRAASAAAFAARAAFAVRVANAAAFAAAESAAFAAFAAADAAAFADRAADAAASASVGAFAAFAAAGPFAAAAAIWNEIRIDAVAIIAGYDPAASPLWSGDRPEWFTDPDRKTREIWAADPPGTWDFWQRWWDGVLSGHQINWDLQRDIVLELTEEDWAGGPARVAERIAEIEGRHRSLGQKTTALSQAALFDFDFDVALRRLEIIGFNDDLSHLKEPELVQAFLDDIEEVSDGLKDFLDYSEAARQGNNALSILGVATDKILAEFNRTKDKTHIRARRIISLSADLFVFSTETSKRDALGEGLCRKLDANVGLLRAVCRKHLSVAIERLAVLDRLELGNQEPAVMLANLKAVLEQVKSEADGTRLARLSPEAIAVLEDMIADLSALEASLSDPMPDGQRRNLQDRFVKGFGAVAATTGRALEKASLHAKNPVEKFDSAVKWYKRWETLNQIVDWLGALGGGPPPGA